jgi:RecA-family ATPase
MWNITNVITSVNSGDGNQLKIFIKYLKKVAVKHEIGSHIGYCTHTSESEEYSTQEITLFTINGNYRIVATLYTPQILIVSGT